jgi:hypothetical protein
MASQADTHATRYHRQARCRRLQLPTERGMIVEASYQIVFPIRQSLHRHRSKPPKRSRGRGDCQGPIAFEATTRALPLSLPQCAQPSDVCCATSAIHMRVC